MSIRLVFIHGNDVLVPGANAMRPMLNPDFSVSNEFVETLDDVGNRLALAPVMNLRCALKE